ncbi:hypothetical protein DHEL01_v206520 [Diaporthe helianthi]|uniref:Ig-like domain-containing protein n=1 Tax=Diaporthe helianthi TaxID=158607 RepID=A0A2P5HXU6_DIAHE|nr:hypothetical protein DHEL01_v206520 [Diaporthe helianthi]
MTRATRLSSLLALVPLATGAILDNRQDNATTIPSRVENGINTECKTCPYSLCPNQLAIGSGEDLTLTCWTYGDNIVDSNIWLRTTDGCYVTQWDIIEYAGDYTNTAGFPFCGDIPQTYTTATSATIYYTECNIIPETVERQDRIKMYKTEVDLTLTCSTDEGESILGNTRWFKTLSNCYVPEAQIEWVEYGVAFDSCGPIPFMETKMRDPDPEPVPEVASFPTTAVTRALHSREEAEDSPKGNGKRWLYLTQIGGDSADCTSEASSTSAVQQVLPFGNYIIVQCATYGAAPETDQ